MGHCAVTTCMVPSDLTTETVRQETPFCARELYHIKNNLIVSEQLEYVPVEHTVLSSGG
jgi:hypothetical protein